jgi:penicillin-binding protein 1A
MSRQARQRRRRASRAGPARILLIGGAVAVTALIVGVIAAVAYVLDVKTSAPSLASLRPVFVGGTSQVFASDGTRLGYIQADQLRSPVGWNEIPADLRNATVAIEDQRFYKNNGVDLTGIVRAAIKDITNRKKVQGGSTITMQLIRNLYFPHTRHTIRQKIIEATLAMEYTKHHGKREILTDYLNSVPYGTVGGQTAIGVQAAARIFFDKPAGQLDLAQSALLAGLPQAPSDYNPFLEPDAARARRNAVLAKMRDLHYITGAQAAEAEAAPLEVKRGYYYSHRQEDFFFEYVHKQLLQRYGAQTVAQGGLRVYTTINLSMQRKARKAIKEVLNQPGDPASAIVTINPANGYIQAMAESQSFGSSQYNLVSQGHRKPGSTFKAIVLADALSRGIDPNSTYYDSHPLEPGWLPAYPTYKVKTFDGSSAGTINLVTATLKSDNTVYAQLAADLGETTVTEMARKMGVVSPLHSYAAEALGGLEIGVTPLEMANVFATLADGGWRNTPIAITKVVFPNGHVDTHWGQPHRLKVLSEAVTAEETRILNLNVQSGTAVKSAITCPTAAKTGTTDELVDAWLDGYTPNYSTAVWMGYPNREVPMTSVHGEAQQGGRLPADIWHAYMSAVTEHQACVPFAAAKEPLSFQPFFGKYATTGRPEAPSEAKSKPQRSTHRPGQRTHAREGGGRGGGRQTPAPHSPAQAPPTSSEKPSSPDGKHHGDETPAAGKTGGASA